MVTLPILAFIIGKCFQTRVRLEFGRKGSIQLRRLVGVPQGIFELFRLIWRLRTIPEGSFWTFILFLVFIFGKASHLIITTLVTDIPVPGTSSL